MVLDVTVPLVGEGFGPLREYCVRLRLHELCTPVRVAFGFLFGLGNSVLLKADEVRVL